MKSFKTVNAYIQHHEQWTEELILLKNLLKETELQETVKWGSPVYTINNKNVVGLGAFKSYVGLWFYQGALLADAENKLINAQDGVTQAMRQWRFNSIEEVIAEVANIKQYVNEAIINQLEGRTVQLKKTKPLVIPDELKIAFAQDLALEAAFEAFSLYKKREFATYVTEAKRAQTKIKRIEKIKPMIINGIGLNDRYRK